VKARELNFATLVSPLARSQAQAVINLIATYLPQIDCQLDILPSPVPVQQKSEAIFASLSPTEVDYLERLLLAETSRLIVVEAADMTLPLPDGLSVSCVPPRATPFDAYLNRQGLIMDEMDPGSRIGVMTMRSRCQMAALWPDLNFRILSGGVDKAMETHLHGSVVDGLVIPAAATENLGIQGIVSEMFAPDFMLPSPGQGILAIVGRTTDAEARELLAELHSVDTAVAMATERAFCSRMVSDQDLPVGALAKVENGKIHIVGATGTCQNRIVVTGGLDDAEAVGMGLAQQILSSGESLADLLEAEFPDGLPDTLTDADDQEVLDEDAAILDDMELGNKHEYRDAQVAGNGLDLDDLEHLKALEDLAGIGADSAKDIDPDEDDEEDESYD